MTKLKLISLKCIWDKAAHNALTDLIYFKNNFYCCFREGEKHAGGKNGCIRILKSLDAINWQSVGFLEKDGIDLRDPMLSQMPDGQLLLNMGGSIYLKNKLISISSKVAFSKNGADWSTVKDTNLHSEWIWRLTWYNGIGYGASYHIDLNDRTKPWSLNLFQTKDGLEYTKLVNLNVPEKPSETTLRFDSNGSMIALVRTTSEGYLGLADFPYVNWNWFPLNHHIGGPNFLILPNDKMIASGRFFKKEKEKKEPYTAISSIDYHSFNPLLELPSGGDNSYPGMVFLNEKIYLSYYSSHEGKALIYLAIIGYHS